MQLNNVNDKYDNAIFQEEKKVIGYLPLGKSGKFTKIIVDFVKAFKEKRWQVIIHGKAVNQNDGLGMKVLAQLLFTAGEKISDILQERLPKLL